MKILTTPNFYYVPGPGWDACTGWGSVDGYAVLQALSQGTTINLTDTTPTAPRRVR